MWPVNTSNRPDLEVLGSSLAHRVVSLNKELYSTLSLFIQVYKWVPTTYFWGVASRWTSIQSRGREEVAILLGILHAKEIGIRSGRLGLWLVCAYLVVVVTCCHREDGLFGSTPTQSRTYFKTALIRPRILLP